MVGYGENAIYDKHAISMFVREFGLAIDVLVETYGEYPEDGYKYYVIVIGGSVLIMEDVSSMPMTGDIDVFSIYLPSGGQELMRDYAMNMRSQAYPYTLPYNYEERLEILAETVYFVAYRVSWEDILFAKLQRNDSRDQNDADNIANTGNFDWILFRDILTDPNDGCGSGITRPAYQELLLAYNEFADRWGEYVYSTYEISNLLDNNIL